MTPFQVMQEKASLVYPSTLVALYVRASSSGHAVNGAYDYADFKTPVSWELADYQRSGKGDYCSPDVQGQLSSFCFTQTDGSIPPTETSC